MGLSKVVQQPGMRSLESFRPIPQGTARLVALAVVDAFIVMACATLLVLDMPRTTGWASVWLLVFWLGLGWLTVFLLSSVWMPHGMSYRQFLRTLKTNNWTENYEIWQLVKGKEHQCEVVYRGPAKKVRGKLHHGHMPFPDFPQLLRSGIWSIALPIGNQTGPGIVLSEKGWFCRHWKVARIKFNANDLLVTDDTGATLKCLLPWFLELLAIDYVVGMDWQLNDSWHDAIDGFLEMSRNQQSGIDNQAATIGVQEALIAELEDAKERLQKENRRLQVSNGNLTHDRDMLATAATRAVVDLLKTKRLGKHGGQASKDAMKIRKDLYENLDYVLGSDSPRVIELARLQGIRERTCPATRTGDEAVQKISR